MATYAVGDIQGCYDQLKCLLDNVQFDTARDELWFTGDLVNRGPKSLETLIFVKSLGKSAKVVLGNHDLHLLALAYGIQKPKSEDSLQAILDSPQCDELIHWLRTLPLLYHDAQLGYTLVHAGLAPQWDLATALRLAKEVEIILQSDKVEKFLQNMYGDKPSVWNEKLTGWKRLRLITNYFTRMRFCDAAGRLDLTNKGGSTSASKGFAPWFLQSNRKNTDLKIIFGHWAALEGKANTKNIFALDTGCVWGGKLTLMCLEDGRRISCNC